MTLKVGDIKSETGLKNLNQFLENRSYIEGFTPSTSDVLLLEAMGKSPDQRLINLKRWYTHINSFDTSERKQFLKLNKSLSDYGVSGDAKPVDNDDDFELFGSDDEVDEEAEKAKEERVKAYQEKKSKKPALVAKSNVILDVKPWDDETNMKALEEKVRTIVSDGLKWGVSKLVPLAYGIHKLQIVCVVEDEKVSIDWLTEEIESLEDFVQSVDIAAFQKI